MKKVPDHEGTGFYFGGGATLVQLTDSVDDRGKLLAIAFSALPFIPKRCFYVSQVPAGTTRGGHAHLAGSQMLFCLNGRVDVLMRDGKSEATVSLADDSTALLIGPRIWAAQTYVKENSVLMVLASHEFDPASYVEDIGMLR